MSTELYYRVTTIDYGDEVTIRNGGYYESVDTSSGCPELQYVGGQPIGFATSDKPQVCGSHSKTGALFAAAFNTKEPTTYYIYTTADKPDYDLSDCPYDFHITEEVRWTTTNDNPVRLSKDTAVALPQTAIEDILSAYEYAPHNPDPAWTDYIKQHLDKTLTDASYSYPTNLAGSFAHPQLDRDNTEDRIDQDPQITADGNQQLTDY